MDVKSPSHTHTGCQSSVIPADENKSVKKKVKVKKVFKCEIVKVKMLKRKCGSKSECVKMEVRECESGSVKVCLKV